MLVTQHLHHGQPQLLGWTGKLGLQSHHGRKRSDIDILTTSSRAHRTRGLQLLARCPVELLGRIMIHSVRLARADGTGEALKMFKSLSTVNWKFHSVTYGTVVLARCATLIWGVTGALEHCIRYYPRFNLTLAQVFITLTLERRASFDPSKPAIPRHLLQKMFQSRHLPASRDDMAMLYRGRTDVPRRVFTPEPRWFVPYASAEEAHRIYTLLVEDYGRAVYGDGTEAQKPWWGTDDIDDAVGLARELEQVDVTNLDETRRLRDRLEFLVDGCALPMQKLAGQYQRVLLFYSATLTPPRHVRKNRIARVLLQNGMTPKNLQAPAYSHRSFSDLLLRLFRCSRLTHAGFWPIVRDRFLPFVNHLHQFWAVELDPHEILCTSLIFAFAGRDGAQQRVSEVLLNLLNCGLNVPTTRRLFMESSFGWCLSSGVGSGRREEQTLESIVHDIRKVQSTFLRSVIASIAFDVDDGVAMDLNGWCGLWTCETTRGSIDSLASAGIMHADLYLEGGLLCRPFLPSAVLDAICVIVEQKSRPATSQRRMHSASWLAMGRRLSSTAISEEHMEVRALGHGLGLERPLGGSGPASKKKRSKSSRLSQIWTGLVKRASTL
ncbi:hypothetical protein M427DRAFT_69889 [Gonapodya prolifera JEL478]|uniref:Uncharacterized protein n=1 Tax=Gonapodya prolifera (strain JEL478) TaxID=1344416 RepID=A0A139AFA3_GONPJ|nr:hypothetical protein M427DRAFT_69889 [Gonapodya prolifera JEL478]|eukprot:KXS15502.1 hypothetical protein M427DRAFT_69889 [Gonapodya prolifera JEL478]